MANFLLLAIVGLIAQLVDGSLGMAYGVTSQSLLLTVGIAPALASASVHIAEVGRLRRRAPPTGGSGTWTGRRSGRLRSLVRSGRFLVR